ELPMLSNILASNRQHLDLALNKIVDSGKRRVGFVGLSFKTGTDDLRESPLVTLAEQLIGKGYALRIYDPEVHLAKLLGANKSFIERHLPHIGEMLDADVANVMANSDVIVLGMNSADAIDAVARHCRPDQLIIDLVRLPNPVAMAAAVKGLCW
ncbi:MAG: GDP-mannose dehydrogenase, partial [Burkholderiales bacterium]|nr:GDP-mannose dehydrogenase [Burkholderiales bacterium]